MKVKIHGLLHCVLCIHTYNFETIKEMLNQHNQPLENVFFAQFNKRVS